MSIGTTCSYLTGDLDWNKFQTKEGCTWMFMWSEDVQNDEIYLSVIWPQIGKVKPCSTKTPLQ